MTIDELTVQVQANADAEASAILLITNLAAMLVAAKNDPVKIQALADKLSASSAALGAAVVANTPSA